MQLFGKSFAASLMILLIGTAAYSAEQTDAEPAASPEAVPPARDQAEIPEQVSPLPKQPKLTHGVFRFHTYPAAWTAAQKTNRPILIYVTSQGCPYCVKMVEKTYQRQQVAHFVVDSFETLYVERHLQPELIEKLKIKLYPTTILVSPSNQVMDVIEGYVDHRVFAQRLQVRLTALAAANSIAGVQPAPRK